MTRLYKCPTCRRVSRVILPYPLCPTCDVTRITVMSPATKPPAHLTGKDLCRFYMTEEMNDGHPYDERGR